MRAEIKRFHSPDIFDLEAYSPAENSNFSFLLQVMIGPEGENSEESFSITICSLLWLEKFLDSEKVMFGMNCIIVKEYNYAMIKSKIESFVGNCNGENWIEIANKISRISLWEFENYND